MVVGRQLMNFQLMNLGSGVWRVETLSGAFLYFTCTEWIYNVPMTLNKCEFHRTLIDMFKKAQQEATHTTTSLSHTHLDTHTHTYTYTQGNCRHPARHLLEPSTSESEGIEQIHHT